MKRHASVEDFLAATTHCKAELTTLRAILRSTTLEETIKWGSPVYTHRGKNVVGLGTFKSYFGLWFFQGALLADRKNVLVNAQEGRTKALRQMRFSAAEEIDERLIRSYVREAIGLVDRGIEIKPNRDRPVAVPAELAAALGRNPKAGASFDRLTTGRRREYAEFVASARREDTKQSRIAKILPMIESGVGLNDRYR